MKPNKATVFAALEATFKLGVAGATIFGIGTLILTQNPESTEVGPREVEADIANFDFAPNSETAKFTEAVKAMGLKPRAYDYNGNVMYFAAGDADNMRPREVLDRVQGHLVDYGVNEQNHARTAPMQQTARVIDWRDAQLDELGKLVPAAEGIIAGDVVPTKVSDDHVEMVGMEFNEEFDQVSDLYKDEQTGEFHERRIADMMGGYKYIDAHWEELQGRSAVTAVWSGEDFSAHRMEGTADDQSPPDPNVPPCMGCERVHRFQGLDPSEPFQQNYWTTNSNINNTYDYYKTSMAARGWKETGAQPYIERIGQIVPEVAAINGKILNLERGDESIQLAIIPGQESQANIFTLHQSKDAQLIDPPGN